MQYQIFIQNPTENHFTASVIGLPDCVAVGATEVEAIDKAKVMLEEQLAKGKIVLVDIPNPPNGDVEHPWRKFAGMWADDPFFDEFVAEMKRERELEDQLERELEDRV